jgi:hypothetical protein
MVYRGLPSGQVEGAGELTRPNIGFTLARLLLIADPEKEDGISALKSAVNDGLADKDKIRTLLDERAITDAHKEEIRLVIADLERKEAAAIEAEAAAAAEVKAAGSVVTNVTAAHTDYASRLNTSRTSIKITWTAASGAVSYNVYEYLGGGNWDKVGSAVTGIEWTHTGLQPGTTHSYMVKAVDSAGAESAASNDVVAGGNATGRTAP